MYCQYLMFFTHMSLCRQISFFQWKQSDMKFSHDFLFHASSFPRHFWDFHLYCRNILCGPKDIENELSHFFFFLKKCSKYILRFNIRNDLWFLTIIIQGVNSLIKNMTHEECFLRKSKFKWQVCHLSFKSSVHIESIASLHVSQTWESPEQAYLLIPDWMKWVPILIEKPIFTCYSCPDSVVILHSPMSCIFSSDSVLVSLHQ